MAQLQALAKSNAVHSDCVVHRASDSVGGVKRQSVWQVEKSAGSAIQPEPSHLRQSIVALVVTCGLMAFCLSFGDGAYAGNADDSGMQQSDARAPSAEFARYRNPRFGYELTLPSTFVAQDPPANGAGQSWLSADGAFELNSFASFNSDGATLQSLKQNLLSGDARFRDAPAAAVAGDILWVFSDSGPRAHGYAAIFSCNNDVVNAVEISFPTGTPDRVRFDEIAKGIVTSLRVGVGADTPPDCAMGQGGPLAATQAAAPSTDHPFSDPSLKRLAVYGWSTAGLQAGLWASGTSGANGTALYIKCSKGRGELRNGSIELRGLRQLSNLSGNHQVNVEIGDYQHGGVFTFSPGDPGSNGMLEITESNETAGVYLEFLRALASGKVLIVEVLDAGYRETFNLFAADYALGPCMGRPTANPWTNHGERDGVYGTSVRNSDGGAFYVRCDSTPGTRGNAVVAFAAPQSVPTPGMRRGQVETIKAFVGTRSQNVQFLITPEPNVVTGVVYYTAGTGGDRKMRDLIALLSRGDDTDDEEGDEEIGDLLSLLGGGTELRLLNKDLGVDTRFSLYGARQALAACSSLYH